MKATKLLSLVTLFVPGLLPLAAIIGMGVEYLWNKIQERTNYVSNVSLEDLKNSPVKKDGLSMLVNRCMRDADLNVIGDQLGLDERYSPEAAKHKTNYIQLGIWDYDEDYEELDIICDELDPRIEEGMVLTC